MRNRIPLNRTIFGRAMFALMMCAVCGGCLEQHRSANVAEIYRAAAQFESPHRRPVIVIPGILGSNLIQEETGRIVWGAFGGGYADPLTAKGARLIALPIADRALHELTDDVVPNGALDRVVVNVLGLPLELNAYHNLLQTLGVGGFRDRELAEAGAVDYGDKHYTCFQFGYDWRRSNAENAAKLMAYIKSTREFIHKQYEEEFGPGEYEIKFNIVAHSMGGLLTRYFLRYGDAQLPSDGSLPALTWAGADYVANAILVGTPNAGSVLALRQLIDGTQPAPIINGYSASIIGSMPSVYELIPRGRHGTVHVGSQQGKPIKNLTDPDVWHTYRWGLVDPDEEKNLKTLMPDIGDAAERQEIARAYLVRCLTNARQFNAALDRPATPPSNLRLYLYAGDAIETPSTLAVNQKTGRVSVCATAPGDGTVTRASALMDERSGGAFAPVLQSPISWHHVTFLFEDHLGLTKTESFNDNVLFQLLERP